MNSGVNEKTFADYQQNTLLKSSCVSQIRILRVEPVVHFCLFTSPHGQ
jgi:hypothetical protein